MNAAELLPAYVAGELSAEERAFVEAALAEAPQLRTELARYEQVFVLLIAAAQAEMEMPADLHRRIVRQVTIQVYLTWATNLATDLLGAYGRAFIYYLRLS